MQLRGLLLLGLLAGAEAAKGGARRSHHRRQNSTPGANPVTTSPVDVVTTSAEDEVTTSPVDDVTTTPSETPTDTDDTTVTRTTTVTNDDAKTVSRKTTVMRTVTSTILVTKTALETTTVTSSDAKTATETVVTTVTTTAKEKRALAPRTVDYNGLDVEAQPTEAPESPYDYLRDIDEESGEQDFELIRRNGLVKRATITRMVTVTEAGDSAKTVVETDTQTVIKTTKKETEVTKTLTKTEQANADTTVTTTSTFIVTETPVATEARTQSSAPTGSLSPTTGDDDSSGLSTGAKAGIGAGAGVVGLAIIAGIIWFCIRKRRRGPKVDEDDLFGSSEVPVGSSGHARVPSTHMTQNTTSAAAAAHLVPNRIPTKSTTQEGYRGTALGDGRAGFAKPQQYGAAYASVSPETAYSRTATTSPGNGPDHLPEHPSPEHPNAVELGQDGHNARWQHSNAQEIDGQQVSSPQGSAPPPQVYEMPTQPFR